MKNMLTTNFVIGSATFSVTGVVCFSREFLFYSSTRQLIIKTALEEAVYNNFFCQNVFLCSLLPSSVYCKCVYNVQFGVVDCWSICPQSTVQCRMMSCVSIVTVGQFVDRALCGVG